MSACLSVVIAACGVFVTMGGTAWGQEPGFSPQPAPPEEFAADQFSRARVVEVLHEEERDLAGYPQLLQLVAAEILGGPQTGRRISAEYVAQAHGTQRRVAPGDIVIVAGSTTGGQTAYYVVEPYRLSFLTVMFILFIGLAILLGRLRGATSLVGLAATVVMLIEFVVPRILTGENPLLVSLLGALIIALVSIYFAHGFSRRTSVAVVATLLTLGISAGLAVAFVALARLFGGGSEEAIFLQFGLQQTLNLRGLLLGGIILGALGVLDDITTGQAAAVDEIGKANPALPVRELYRREFSVSTEHITALVNTLFLAYAGASLPLFLLFTQTDQPLWVIVNSEFVAEEIVRTLVGSIALMLAVPITTLLAAVVLHSRHSTTSPAG